MLPIVLRKLKWADALGPHVGIDSLDSLRSMHLDGRVLIAFQSGIIIPKDVLAKVRAYNFHPGTPNYPGRDPHHWAIYDRVTHFGATCHVMTDRVDAGPIIRVARFPLVPGFTPDQLRECASEAALWLYQEILPSLMDGTAKPNGEVWTGKKHTRADFLRMCELDGLPKEEARWRLVAFGSGEHDNFQRAVI
jgi:methionyl-tRNA formyltransferase